MVSYEILGKIFAQRPFVLLPTHPEPADGVGIFGGYGNAAAYNHSRMAVRSGGTWSSAEVWGLW